MDLGELLRSIDAYSGHLVTCLAMKIAPYVMARPGELRKARWSECDLENAVWNIPDKDTNDEGAVASVKQALSFEIAPTNPESDLLLITEMRSSAPLKHPHSNRCTAA